MIGIVITVTVTGYIFVQSCKYMVCIITVYD